MYLYIFTQLTPCVLKVLFSKNLHLSLENDMIELKSEEYGYRVLI